MDDLDAARIFSVLNRRSQSYVVAACAKLDITYSEYILLIRIYESEGLSQDDLSAMLYVDKAFVTRVVKLLEAKNLIRREKDSVDRRVKRIFLTEYGRTQHEFLLDVLYRWTEYLVEGLDKRIFADTLKGLEHLANRSIEADFQEVMARKRVKREE